MLIYADYSVFLPVIIAIDRIKIMLILTSRLLFCYILSYLNIMKTAVLFFFLLFPSFSPLLIASHNPDDIVGYWMHSGNKLKVQVYKVNGEYFGKIIWFEDSHYKAKMDDCVDDQNPDPALRNRKVLGLVVVSSLRYNAEEDNWGGGLIYDSNTGKTYDSVVNMYTASTITVTGYWMFEWLGKSTSFYRVYG